MTRRVIRSKDKTEQGLISRHRPYNIGKKILRSIKWQQLILWRRDGKEMEGSREFISNPIVCSVAQTPRGLPSSARNTLLQCLSQTPVTDRIVPPRRLCFPFLGIPRKGSSKARTFSLPGFLTCPCQTWE